MKICLFARIKSRLIYKKLRKQPKSETETETFWKANPQSNTEFLSRESANYCRCKVPLREAQDTYLINRVLCTGNELVTPPLSWIKTLVRLISKRVGSIQKKPNRFSFNIVKSRCFILRKAEISPFLDWSKVNVLFFSTVKTILSWEIFSFCLNISLLFGPVTVLISEKRRSVISYHSLLSTTKSDSLRNVLVLSCHLDSRWHVS